MSISISMRDLRLIDELSHLSEIKMLEIENDAIVNKYLRMFGFDTCYGLCYLPSNHKDMSGKVALGFRIVGEVECNKSFIDGPFASVVDRLVAYSYNDRSWAKELAELAGKSPNFKEAADQGLMAFQEVGQDFPADQCEKDWQNMSDQIAQLEMIRDEIRGSMWNAGGSLKTPEEYQQPQNL